MSLTELDLFILFLIFKLKFKFIDIKKSKFKFIEYAKTKFKFKVITLRKWNSNSNLSTPRERIQNQHANSIRPYSISLRLHVFRVDGQK